MEEHKKEGRDEMNLAVLPIALLGRNDTREKIEYYGTFYDGKKQQTMVWTVRGPVDIGLPTEFGERVLVALFYLGAQDNFANRRLEFTTYQVLKVLGCELNGWNYKAVETALTQLAGVLITSDNAWIEKKKDGTQERITTKRGFHIIDEFYLHYAEGGSEGDTSFIVWGSRIWRNLQGGYIRRIDINFYYSLNLPLARRLYRFLDKVTHYKPYTPYTIDVFDLANKLGLAQYQYASHLKRPLSAAADELIERGYLAKYEFFKIGKFTRLKLYRQQPPQQVDSFDTIVGTITKPEPDPWLNMLAEMSPSMAENLKDTQLVSIENGKATIQARLRVNWLNRQLAKRVAHELRISGHEVNEVIFVE